MKKGIFTSNLSLTSAKIDGTEGFKKYCAGHSKPLHGPWVGCLWVKETKSDS